MDINMEHRTPGGWDWMPIVGNFRSHSLTTTEAEVIESIGQDLGRAQDIITKYGLPMDLSDLVAHSKSIKKPEGFSMLMGTLFPSFRSMHRGHIAPRVLHLQGMAAKSVRGVMNAESQRNVSTAA
jgi:hypothetical protein